MELIIISSDKCDPSEQSTVVKLKRDRDCDIQEGSSEPKIN